MTQPSSIRIPVDVEPLREAVNEIIDTVKLVSVMAEVGEALESARAKHGKQHHLPLGIGPNEHFMRDLGEHTDLITWLEDLSNTDLERTAKNLCEDRGAGPTWAKIAFEEVAEFLAAGTPAEARAEALQAAAMFVSIVTLIDEHTS